MGEALRGLVNLCKRPMKGPTHWATDQGPGHGEGPPPLPQLAWPLCPRQAAPPRSAGRCCLTAMSRPHRGQLRALAGLQPQQSSAGGIWASETWMGEELSLRTPHSHHPRKATHARQNGPPIPGDGGTQEKCDPAAERCLREFIIGTQFRCHGTFFRKRSSKFFGKHRAVRPGPLDESVPRISAATAQAGVGGAPHCTGTGRLCGHAVPGFRGSCFAFHLIREGRGRGVVCWVCGR